MVWTLAEVRALRDEERHRRATALTVGFGGGTALRQSIAAGDVWLLEGMSALDMLSLRIAARILSSARQVTVIDPCRTSDDIVLTCASLYSDGAARDPLDAVNCIQPLHLTAVGLDGDWSQSVDTVIHSPSICDLLVVNHIDRTHQALRHGLRRATPGMNDLPLMDLIRVWARRRQTAVLVHATRAKQSWSDVVQQTVTARDEPGPHWRLGRRLSRGMVIWETHSRRENSWAQQAMQPLDSRW